MKKIFIISAVLLVVVLIFLGIYNFAFKKEEPAIIQTTSVETKNSIVPIKPEKITSISDGAVIGPIVDKKTEEIKYYDALTGIVWKMDSDGAKKEQITTVKVLGLKNALWSADHNKVLTTIQKEEQNSFYFYDHQAQTGSLLKNGLDTVVWDNLGTKIFYKYFNSISKERTLNISNPDGSDWQKIADITAKNLNIAPVPSTSLISYWNSPNAIEETQLQVISITGGEAKTILSGKYGADYLWSPDGSKAIVSSLPNKDTKTVLLGVVTIDGKYQELNIPTLVSKCAWSLDNKTIYYALPGGIPAGVVMPNDYQENKFNTEDTFWKMDITTGEKERIIETADIKGKYDSSNMFLSATEDALYFVNKIDQKLYRLEL
ncbi:MAG: hypothetical protein US70_C0004G0029 [Parcubacteria group bacterium GW2011_GWD2_38_11]|nr:MAG: hypothetical protein US70_C0004G0029 [Parcubacteria group bacterium GW2011_GWD2_38_11]